MKMLEGKCQAIPDGQHPCEAEARFWAPKTDTGEYLRLCKEHYQAYLLADWVGPMEPPE